MRHALFILFYKYNHEQGTSWIKITFKIKYSICLIILIYSEDSYIEKLYFGSVINILNSSLMNGNINKLIVTSSYSVMKNISVGKYVQQKLIKL